MVENSELGIKSKLDINFKFNVMKKIIGIFAGAAIIFLSLAFTYSHEIDKTEKIAPITKALSDYCEGWDDGYCEGWKDVKGQYAICPIPPICPIPKIDCNKGYRCGYNRGFKAGMKAARND